MPFVQISILKGKSPESILNISNSVHQALVEEFGIPESDRFQVVNEIKGPAGSADEQSAGCLFLNRAIIQKHLSTIG